MPDQGRNDSLNYEAPYPLRAQYVTKVVPTLVILAIVIGIMVAFGSQYLIHQIYLQISADKAEVIDRALKRSNRDLWNVLPSSERPDELFATADGIELLNEIRKEVEELGLHQLKIYSNRGVLLYSTDETQIGNSDVSYGFTSALQGTNNLIEKEMTDGTKLYELYVLVPNNRFNLVMELYEPISYLDSITLEAIIPSITFPILLLIFLTLITGHLITRAQSDINYRTELLRSFSTRLSKLVSSQAAHQLRDPNTSTEIPSQKVLATIIFTDIRGFTDYCEKSDPDEVVSFLNTSLGIVIRAIKNHGGDVDKLIGDAVLGFFVGEKAQVQALAAAKESQAVMKEQAINPGIGIGIYTGEVISGAVGDSERMDFTMIGDSVNVASRLCSSAKEDEIVIDQDSYIAANHDHSLTLEHISVKGRNQAISIYRIA